MNSTRRNFARHRRRIQNRLRTLLTLLAGGLWLTATAWGHAGQHLDLKIKISDSEVVFNILLSNDYAKHLVTFENYHPQYSAADQTYHFPNPETGQRLRDAYEAYFSPLDLVRIDGWSVKSILTRLDFVSAVNALGLAEPEAFPPDLTLQVVFPCKGRPKQVAMVWELYPIDPARAALGQQTSTALLAEIEAFDERQLIVFSPEEPEVIWHAPVGTAAQRVRPVVTAVEPAKITIPLVSLGVAAAWTLGLIGLHISKVKRSVRKIAWWCSPVPVVLAFSLHNVATASFRAPWKDTVQPPAAEEAKQIFTTLQRNVYRAFDYKNESDVYDVLAQSVAGDLLDRVYNEVYQSLILRDQGGAVAHVNSVDVLDTELLSAGQSAESGRLAFSLRCRWLVYGVVAHWGHFHSRTNEYEAHYTVAQIDKNWKIVGVEVLQQHRVDDGENNLSDAGGTP